LDRCQAILSEALGVPNGWEGAIEFGIANRELLIAILVTQFLEPINDLLVLPGEGRSFIKFSHHDVVHISCATQEEIDLVIAFMSAAKFELPDELPDPTFKRPAWMRRTGGDV